MYYLDIGGYTEDDDYEVGVAAYGVRYLINEQHLKSLVACEGYPKIYIQILVEIEYNGKVYQVIP